MKYLLDTNVILWYLNDDIKLPDSHKTLIDTPGSFIFISIVSLWEIAIKSSLGKLNLDIGFDKILSAISNSEDFSILTVNTSHLKVLLNLPFYHKDPFDRLIYAQSLSENLSLIYTDKIFDQYQLHNSGPLEIDRD